MSFEPRISRTGLDLDVYLFSLYHRANLNSFSLDNIFSFSTHNLGSTMDIPFSLLHIYQHSCTYFNLSSEKRHAWDNLDRSCEGICRSCLVASCTIVVNGVVASVLFLIIVQDN